MLRLIQILFGLLTTLVFSLGACAHGCPHEGTDRRSFGSAGCWLQRELTIENASAPRTLWSFHVHSVSVKIDPRHPHLLVEWPASQHRLWLLRAGFRWDANARAYIFPAMALKKVDEPLGDYLQTRRTPH